MPAFGQISKIKMSQNLKQRIKTIERRKTGQARRDDLPLSKAKILTALLVNSER